MNNRTIPSMMAPFDGASVLACAYQLKVRSKNPTDFEYWFRQQLISKICNVYIKQSTSVDAGAILLYFHISVALRFPACAQFHEKTPTKLTAPHDGASVLACAYQLKVRSQNPKDFEH